MERILNTGVSEAQMKHISGLLIAGAVCLSLTNTGRAAEGDGGTKPVKASVKAPRSQTRVIPLPFADFEKLAKIVQAKLDDAVLTGTATTTSSLNDLSAIDVLDDSSRFAKLRDNAKSVKKDELLTKLPAAIADVNNANVALDTIYNSFKDLDPDTIESPGKERVKKMQSDYKTLAGKVKAANEAPKNLQAAIVKAGGNLTKFLGKWKEKTESLALLINANGPVLLDNLGAPLSEFATLTRLRREFGSLLELQTALDETGVAGAAVAKLKFDGLDSAISAVLPLIGDIRSNQPSSWLDKLTDLTEKRDGEAFDKFLKFVEVTEGQRYEAERERRVALARNKDDLTALKKILTAAIAIREQVQKSDFPPALKNAFDGRELSDNIETLKHATLRLEQTIGLLRESFPADVSRWVSDQITLFYFDDVGRMMKVLNKESKLTGDEEKRKEAAVAAKQALTKVTLELIEKRQDVNNARTELERRREELRQARLSAKDAQAASDAHETRTESVAARRQRKIRDLEYERDLAKARNDRIQRQLTTADEIEKKRLQPQADEAQYQFDIAELNLKRAQNLSTDATGVETETTGDLTEQLTKASANFTAAQATLAAAEAAEKNAVQAAGTASGTALISALDDNRAFALARDNAPFYQSLPAFAQSPPATTTPAGESTTDANGETPKLTSLDTDPVRRVMLYGFPDTRTIFIRGTREDVRRVKNMISSFDVPKTQTLLTLHTLEISSKADKNGAQRTSQALQIIQNELAVSRIQTEASLALLRECVTNQIRESVEVFKAQKTNGGLGGYSDEQLAAVAFYDYDVLREFGVELDPKVLAQPTPIEESLPLINMMLPRPLSLSTLAETLVVLSLGKTERQNNAWKQFRSLARQRITAKTVEILGEKRALEVVGIKEALAEQQALEETQSPEDRQILATRQALNNNPLASFSNLSLFFGEIDSPFNQKDAGIANATGLSNLRHEMVEALLRHGAPNMLAFAQKLIISREHISKRLQDLAALPASRVRDISIDQAYRDYARIDDTIPHKWLIRNFPFSSEDQIFEYFRRTPLDEIVIQFNSGIDPDGTQRSNNARIGAANEVLKKNLTNINDDLERQFVQPMLSRLRRRLISEAGINVGVLQSTSILGVNRLEARVDPVASSQLQVGQEKNVLQLLTTLSILQGNFAPVVGKGGKVSGVATTAGAALAGGAPAGAAALLQAVSASASQIDRLPQDAPAGVYGVTSGNTFQVTPIADPTGQALRFRFDHVLSTQIREPNNSVDPQLSRIERHGINTEVQLSNHEIRLVSQFDATARIGVPTQRSGGIPILKDIPVLNELPLIGWFVRRGGKAATVQQSIVLAQATMFPTLGDIIELMTRPIHTLGALAEPGPSGLAMDGYIAHWNKKQWSGKIHLCPGTVGEKEQDVEFDESDFDRIFDQPLRRKLRTTETLELAAVCPAPANSIGVRVMLDTEGKPKSAMLLPTP
jgi:hypothetical protein